MKKLIIITALFIGFNSQAQDQATKAKVLLESLITKDKIVGAAGGFTIDGETVWQMGAGYADRKSEVKFTPTTITRLASIAKSMTAIAVMQLVEQDLIDLDTPIQTYIPDYPKHEKTQITTRHLLSHTSGIGGYTSAKDAQTKVEYPTLYDALEIFKDRELLFEPGTRYSYTTYGYTVLGVIVERASGMTFEDYMQKNIWDKAGMTNTGVEKFGQKKPNQSSLYHQIRKGKSRDGKENNLSNRIPGGGVYSTLEDMLKFGNAVINNVFVKESTMDLMREHHSLEKERNGYGFGWFLYNPKPNEGAIIGHSGEQTGSCTQIVIVPSLKLVTVILTNTSGTFSEVQPATFNLFNIANEK
ncbi:serine hydrolase [Roseivirga sp. E12]|uniref:serine hydrolase domain-containing protein n=1 Tax=Roseivirga sp. E12 TaxID=2819237 RepID=UPI001ABD37D5|nr:serine hydrolase domain-containing protein [Roseivirga sp. E12]MBO3696879.1 beta-lactamase family protein [Roseivirga sp. E12]